MGLFNGKFTQEDDEHEEISMTTNTQDSNSVKWDLFYSDKYRVSLLENGAIKIDSHGSVTVMPSLDKIIDSALVHERQRNEGVAIEALHERDKLGYTVVKVIGKLDEIYGQAQECELDDITQIAIPLDMWDELQDALEEMPERAELFTSPQQAIPAVAYNHYFKYADGTEEQVLSHQETVPAIFDLEYTGRTEKLGVIL